MIPITRKEYYLNRIVGNNNYETPEKPITTEEFFFAEILGEAVQAPEPLTRYQMYLAKIAGKDVEIPYPETRLEYFLAKAAGMEIETPVPITREEIYWSNYTAIVDFEVEGVPPLSFKAKAGALKDYRIYGQTSRNLSEVNEFSNSITDTSDNLQIWVQQGKDQSFEYPANSNIFIITEPTTITTRITITNDNDSIRIKHNGSKSDIVIDIVRGLSPGAYSVSFNVLNYDHTTVGGLVINNIMVNTGSTPLPYEPYGESVGDRTGNLCENSISGVNISSNGFIYADIHNDVGYAKVVAGETYTINSYVYAFFEEEPKEGDRSYDNGRVVGTSPSTFEAPINGYVAFRTESGSQLQCNEGNNLLPYEPYGYRVPVTVTNNNNSQTTNLYLPEQIRKVGDEAEYIDYAEQKQHRVRKNLLKNTVTSQTINGVTFTVNSDGSITCNGTASAVTFFTIPMTINQGYYIASGCPIGSNFTTPYVTIRLRTPSGGTDVPPFPDADFGRGVTISSNKNNNDDYYYKIRVPANYTCDNLTFYPTIRKADIEDDTYEPYITNTELDVTLPALPVLPGTNTLTVGTEVQPSKVYIKGQKERD